jgi:hypothetical protein
MSIGRAQIAVEELVTAACHMAETNKVDSAVTWSMCGFLLLASAATWTTAGHTRLAVPECVCGVRSGRGQEPRARARREKRQDAVAVAVAVAMIWI